MLGEAVRGGFPAPGFFSLPGIEQARAAERGRIPRVPLSHLVGLTLTQVGPGKATVTMPASPWLVDHPRGTVQLSVLIERALYFAALTGAPPAVELSTTTLSTSYLRPATLDSGPFVARARVINSGHAYTLAEVTVEDAIGRVTAQSIASLRARPISPSPPLLPGPLASVAAPAYQTPDPYLRPYPPAVLEDESLSTLRRTVAGELPTAPALQLFDARLLNADEGSVTVALRTSEWFCSLRRTVAPGVLAYLALVSLNGAATTVAPSGHVTGILNTNLTFLRVQVPDGREVVARGSVVHHAADLVISSAELIDADGNRVAIGQQSAVLRRRRTSSATAEPQRALLTILFTDIVRATERAETLGDQAWRDLLDAHHASVRKQLGLFNGKELKSTGDGFLATFESPARAIQCARAIRSSAEHLNLEVRAAVHTGECELMGADIAGIAVHVAARLLTIARPSEIVVSSTVRDLVDGSGAIFKDLGEHRLKGIQGERRVFAVAD